MIDITHNVFVENIIRDEDKISVNFLNKNNILIEIGDIIFFDGFYLMVEDIKFKEYAKLYYWFKPIEISNIKVETLKCKILPKTKD